MAGERFEGESVRAWIVRLVAISDLCDGSITAGEAGALIVLACRDNEAAENRPVDDGLAAATLLCD